jgi:transcriptional regulator with XRE-family HTH domain
MTRKETLDPRFGQLLKFLRQRAKVTLEKLASETELDVARLSRMENGTYPAPDLSVLEKIATCLEIEEGSTEAQNLFEFSIANRDPDLYRSVILHGIKKRMSQEEYAQWLGSYRAYKRNPQRVHTLIEADQHQRDEIARCGQVIESVHLVYRVSDPRLGNRIEYVIADVENDQPELNPEAPPKKLIQRFLRHTEKP